MVAEKKKPAATEKDQLASVGPEHQAILRELVETYGTIKNAVGKALELLHRQTNRQHRAKT